MMLNLQILTPEKIAYDGEADLINVPSMTGQLTILPRHIGLLTPLTEGVIRIGKGKEEFFFSIGEGFLQVGKAEVVILISRAYRAEELDEKKILEAKAAAEKILKEKPKGEELSHYQALLRRSLIDLKTLQRRKGRKL